MPIIYRTTGPWGTGKGANLTASEVDGNFHDLNTRLEAVVLNPPQGNGIASIHVIGTQMTIFLEDGTYRGPFTLPSAMIHWRGDWAPGTAYKELDLVFVPDLGTYLVQRDHTSAATFNPNASVSGQALYRFLMYAGMPDAPSDGQSYVRQDGAWVVPTSLEDAPGDGALYGRMSGDWVPVPSILPDAPADGVLRGRLDGAWVAVPDDYLSEAPTGGGLYARGGGNWVSITEGAGIGEAPVDSMLYVRKDGTWVPLDARVVQKTGSYILEAADRHSLIRMNSDEGNTVTVPANATVAFPPGTIITVEQEGAGQTTIVAASGVTIDTSDTLALRKQFSVISLIKKDTDRWSLSGDTDTL